MGTLAATTLYHYEHTGLQCLHPHSPAIKEPLNRADEGTTVLRNIGQYSSKEAASNSKDMHLRQHHTVRNPRLASVILADYVPTSLCYKPQGRGFDFRWSHWDFSLT